MYNIALFGAGRIGQVHAVNIANHPETNLYSVIDPYDVNATCYVINMMLSDNRLKKRWQIQMWMLCVFARQRIPMLI